MPDGWTIVLDVGKSLSKASLWDEAGHCMALSIRPNRRRTDASRPHAGCRGIEQWLESVLLIEYAALGPVAALIPSCPWRRDCTHQTGPAGQCPARL